MYYYVDDEGRNREEKGEREIGREREETLIKVFKWFFVIGSGC